MNLDHAQFDALPDREVDAIIAEKVMGWTWCCRNWWDDRDEAHLLHPDDLSDAVVNAPANMKKSRSCFRGSHERGRLLPHYSTDLNACHDMEKNGSLRGDLQLFTWRRYVDFLQAVCIPHGVIQATARQKCKAALMALGVITEAAQEGGRK